MDNPGGMSTDVRIPVPIAVTMEDLDQDESKKMSLTRMVSAYYYSTEVTNLLVIYLLVVVMVAYIITFMVIAILEGKRLPQGRLHMPVGDILDRDHYYYVVTVATGQCRNSGLTPPGQVQITLRGTALHSSPLVIRNLDSIGTTNVLKRGGVDYFLLPVPRSLGEIEHVDIDLFSHLYEKISWYVRYIRVTNIKYGIHNDFPFDCWLSTFERVRMGAPQSRMSACRYFGERFRGIYSDLNIWTSIWTRSSQLGAFRRSVRISFCLMTLACLMAANIITCFFTAVKNQQIDADMQDQLTLIEEALILGLAANGVVFMFQYLFELLLRRVRTSSDHYLAIHGKNRWKKKPLPSTMEAAGEKPSDISLNCGYYRADFPSYRGSTGKNNQKKSKSSQSINLTVEMKEEEPLMSEYNNLPAVMEDENEDAVDDLVDGSGYYADDEFGSRYKEISTKVLEEETDMTSTKVLEKETDMTNTVCDSCSGDSINYNLNANTIDVPKPDYKETITNQVKHLLWNEEDGIVAKYIKMHEKETEGKSKPKIDNATKVQNADFARYLVSLVLEDAKMAMISGEDACMENVQDLVLKKLQADFKKSYKFMDMLSQCKIQAQDDVKVDNRRSEGKLGGQVFRKGTDLSLSVSSSCPEVQSPKPSEIDIDDHGPVANRLSESITALAYRNSYTSLQKNATDTLVRQSKDRISSFTNLLQETNSADQNLMIPSLPSPELLTGMPRRTDKIINVKTLLESISSNRAERLTDKSMNYIAKASLSALVSEESLLKLRDTAEDFNQKSMKGFTYEVVNNLYSVLKWKLEDLLKANPAPQSTADKSKPEQIADFLAASGDEIQTSVVPQLAGNIQALLEDQVRSFVEVDLAMQAFSGQYIDTIVTNAVLQTHVGLLKAKRCLCAEQEATDSNVNNNTEDAIKLALVQLQQTPDSKKIVDLLCRCMLNGFKNKKGCTVDHPKAINQVMMKTFMRSASSSTAFESVLAEAASYLQLLSEHCDMKRVHEESPLVARLAEQFLFSGFEIETHSALTEELSSTLLDNALEHACVVVGEQLIVPYLKDPSKNVMPEQETSISTAASPGNVLMVGASSAASQRATSTPQTELDWSTAAIGPPHLKSNMEMVGGSSAASQRATSTPQTELDWSTASTGPPNLKSNMEMVGASPVASQLATSTPQTELDWSTASTGSPHPKKSPVQTSGKELNRSQSDSKKPKRSRRKLGDQLNEKRSPQKKYVPLSTADLDTSNPNQNISPKSPMRSSTPRTGSDIKDLRDSFHLEKMSPMQSLDEVDFGTYRHRPYPTKKSNSADTQRVWRTTQATRSTFSDTGSSRTGESVPLMPKEYGSMISYDDNLSQRGDVGLVYLPCNGNIEAGGDSLAEREKIWQLDLERDIFGETTKCLAPCVMYFLQVLIILITVAALSICVLIGLRLPNSSAAAWSVALVVGVLEHALVFETLKVALVALYYVSCFDANL